MEQLSYALSDLIDNLIPIGICVVLPVLIVWLVMRKKTNDTNKRTEIALAALEKNSEIDVEAFFKQMNPQQKLLKEKLLKKLLIGVMFTVLGIALLCFIIYMENKFPSLDEESLVIFYTASIVGLSVGFAYMINFFIGRRMLEKEIEIESKEKEK